MTTPMASSAPRDGNIALLIDADNASPAGIDPVLTVLAELGTVNVRRAYGNWRKPGLKSWADLIHRYGIEPSQQFDLTKGKNATDMKMTIDAMDLMWAGRVDGFGIMSSDSDFMPLAMRLRQQGLPVYGFGNQRAPEGFQAACTRFIDVGRLVAGREAPSPPAGVLDVPGEEAGASKGERAGEVTGELLTLLVDAYNASKRDERGFVNLRSLGQLAGNRSSFDARNYGYSRLSDLMADVPNFQSEKREGGQVFVKRVR